jgi:solute carrier family 25 iron transporter 28/37
MLIATGPAHAVYFGTYEIVKEMAGGNVDDGHHPLAAGKIILRTRFTMRN